MSRSSKTARLALAGVAVLFVIRLLELIKWILIEVL